MSAADSMDILESDRVVGIASARDPIRGVLFDIDGTLYRQPPVRRAIAARVARRYWREPRSGLRTVRTLSAFRQAQETLRTRGPASDIALAQIELTAARTGAAANEVTAIVHEWMARRPLDLIAANARSGLARTLDELRDRGVRLGVVSDYPAPEKLAVLGILDRFDAVVSADDPRVHAFKPDPTALLVALGDLGVRPSEALYVGDRFDVDAGAAAAAGMACALIARNPFWPDTRGVTWLNELVEVVDLVGRP